MVKEDGGPAFPIPNDRGPTTGMGIQEGSPGMSLRDWFAGQALAGMLVNGFIPKAFNPGTSTDPLANDTHRRLDYVASAYEIADAMLAYRKDTSND